VVKAPGRRDYFFLPRQEMQPGKFRRKIDYPVTRQGTPTLADSPGLSILDPRNGADISLQQHNGLSQAEIAARSLNG